MSSSSSMHIGYADRANRHTRNIVFAAWVIFPPNNELVSSRGIYLGLATNNVIEYSVLIKLMSQGIALSIHHFMVRLDSQLVSSQLNSHYCIRHPILFHKYLRIHLLERQFEFITYQHITRQYNTIANSLANYVLDWHITHSNT